MATLTIKPTAAGNDVQIKSGDGNTTHATFGDTSTVNMSAGTISGGTIASAVTGTLGSGITFPAGHILQTVSSTFTGVANGTGTTPTLPHADCSVDITPSHASNKILITVHSTLQTTGNAWASLHFFKDASEITGAVGDDSQSLSTNTTTSSGYSSSADNVSHLGYALYPVSAQYLDTAGSTGTPITYDFRVRARASSWYVNRTRDGSNADHIVSTISTITVQEIMRA